jgi:hypothetical protein
MTMKRIRVTITIVVWCVFVGLALWGVASKRTPSYKERLEVMIIDGCYSHQALANTLEQLGFENHNISPGASEKLIASLITDIKLPDLVIMPESTAADYLEMAHSTMVELTPFVEANQIPAYELDFGSLYYPCYHNGHHYFMTIGNYLIEDPRTKIPVWRGNKLFGEFASPYPKEKAVIGIMQTSRSEELAPKLFPVVQQLASRKLDWNNHISMLIAWFFRIREPKRIYQAFLHSDVLEALTLEQWETFYRQEFLPETFPDNLTIWLGGQAAERHIGILRSPWNNQVYEDVLKIEVEAKMGNFDGTYRGTAAYFVYLAKDIWVGPEDTIPGFCEWKVIHAGRQVVATYSPVRRTLEAQGQFRDRVPIRPLIPGHPLALTQSFFLDYLQERPESIGTYLCPEVDVTYFPLGTLDKQTIRLARKEIENLYTNYWREYLPISNISDIQISFMPARSTYTLPRETVTQVDGILNVTLAERNRFRFKVIGEMSSPVSVGFVNKNGRWLIDRIHWGSLPEVLPDCLIPTELIQKLPVENEGLISL